MNLPLDLIRPGRRITGMAAVLLPYTDDGDPDWGAFERLVGRTTEAGLVPAVDMDTGYIDLLDSPTADRVLEIAARATAGASTAEPDCDRFVAGAFVGDHPGAGLDLDAYMARMERIQSLGGTPVVFPSWGLASEPESELASVHQRLASGSDRFYAFELGPQFAPFDRIYSLDTYSSLLEIPQCAGAKHSSLDRIAEWERIRLRDRERPDFLVLTGNDLAIDMVLYGSDYLLGLAAFAPDAFARRDRYWEEGDARFYPLCDALQFLGAFAFREPVPAYKHSAAQFLQLRGWIPTANTHPRATARPDGDRAVLRTILERIEQAVAL